MICSNTHYLSPSLHTLSVGESNVCVCVWESLPKDSHSDWLPPCHSDAVRGWVGEAYCHQSVNICLYVGVSVCVPSWDAQWHLGPVVPRVSCQASVEVTSYFELFYPHLKPLSSRLPCSHSPCPPTWNWGFTALIAKVVLSFRASTFHHERLFCQTEENLDTYIIDTKDSGIW